MFAVKKLVLVAACVALALGPAVVTAEQESSHLRIRIHEHGMKAVNEASSGAGLDMTAPAGGSSDDDSDDSDDSEDSDDDKDAAGSSGSAATAGEVGDEPTLAVDPVPPTTPTDGGSGETKTEEPVVEVLIDVVADPTEKPTPAADKPFCSGEGEYQVSVEYAEGVYCVKGRSCVSDQSDGVCPGPQKGLPFGSRCDKVLSGVYGCTMNREAQPASSAPATAAAGTESSGSSAADSEDSEDSKGPVDSADFCPGEDEFEMSVEGASGVYCIKGQACVADIADGVCPGPQKGLPFGSSCGTVASGAYGCKVNGPPANKHHKKEQSPKKKAKHAKKHQSDKKVAKSKKSKAKAKAKAHGDSKKKTAAKHNTHASTKGKAAKTSGAKKTRNIRSHDAKTQH